MAYNHEYPYTDPSRYNADWLLASMKNVLKRMDEYEKTAKELQDALKDIDYLKEAVKPIAGILADINTLKANEKYLTESIELLKIAVDGIEVRIKSVYAYIDSIANQLDIKLNNRIYEIRKELYISNAQLNAEIAALREYVQYVEEHSSADVLNEIIGKRVTLDVNNKEINSHLRYGGLRECELMELGLTEAELADYNLTQRDFAYRGRQFLKKLFIFSPVSGKRMRVNMALSDVLTFMCNTLTEAEREAMDLTESELEALDLTAIEWLTYRP